MANETTIQQDLVNKFSFLADKIRIQRERRIFAEVDGSKFHEVFDYVVTKMDFPMLCIITGIDEGDNLGFMYHLARRDGTMLNIKALVPKSKPIHKTVTNYFPAATLYERELVDLFGAQITGLPPGARYPLPDGWPEGQYPLRKDWKPEMLNDKTNLNM